MEDAEPTGAFTRGVSKAAARERPDDLLKTAQNGEGGGGLIGARQGLQQTMKNSGKH